MKKIIFLNLVALVLVFATTPVMSDSLVADIDTVNILTDINISYWADSDYNGYGNDQLDNANPVTEEAWLEGLLGKAYNDASVIYNGKIEAGEGDLGVGVKQITGFNPGFTWDYAVVKYGNYWLAYEDTGNDDRLSTNQLSKGISHITFFDPPQQVPEPATLLLLGSGLVGLALIRRKKR